ncbi:MAG: HEPN domain-containing protein [Candidatus Thermoplasmatota archaeon]|nr:HEPN domain-containing protein [Candidatus Thermoplasmatota archaeon]
MEDKGIARDAIESAKRWLSSSIANAEAGNYDLAVYSLEMSTEISLKALLFFNGIEAPKTHSIGDLVTKTVKEDAKLSKILGTEIEEFVHTFNSLWTLRSISGYIFETRSTLDDMRVKYERFAKETTRIVEMCDRAVGLKKRR